MNRPFIGHGVGLRVPHYERALEGKLGVDWVEVITENFFGGGGRPRAVLEALRRDVPLVFHGVSLGVGSMEGPASSYLAQVKALADAFEPAWLSDHLCWTACDGHFAHELLPLPYTEEALDVVVRNVVRAQDALGRALVLENVSSYVGFSASQMPEWEFVTEVALRSGCFILLDLNNIIVSAHNHGFSPLEYLDKIPRSKVWQFHLANHSDLSTHKFDDHRGAVPAVVWELFEAALLRYGAVSSSVEWDEDVPSFDVLLREQEKASARARAVLGRALVQPSAPERPLPAPANPPAARRSRATLTRGSLESSQRLFLRAVTWPTGARSFLVAAGPAAQRELEETFATSAAFDRVDRVDVYANAYFYRLLSTLRELFPRLLYLAGDAPFHNLVTDYLLEHPPREPDLRRLGERLPSFLQRHVPSALRPIFAEVAALESALVRALDAAEGRGGLESELVAVPTERWPGLRLVFSSPTTRVVAHHDLIALVELCDGGHRDAALSLARAPDAAAVLVGRCGLRVYFRRLGSDEDRALRLFMEGASLGSVCDELLRREPSFRADSMLGYLRRWLTDGAIGNFSLDM